MKPKNLIFLFLLSFGEVARAMADWANLAAADNNFAFRALAFKWQSIMWRCWKDRLPYDDTRYVTGLMTPGKPEGHSGVCLPLFTEMTENKARFEKAKWATCNLI